MMNFISKYRNYIYVFLLVGFVVYLPGLFNGFAWDDYSYILSNTDLHPFDFSRLLGPNLFNSGMFYRPVPSIYFATLYSMFHQLAFFYHFVQITLHILSTILLFALLLRFFPRILASFLALIFLVHPANVESVAFISSTTSEIYFIFGISALLLGIDRQPKNKKIFSVFLLLLLSILTKETGFLFFPLILLYRYIYKLGKMTKFVLAGFITGIVYLLMRSVIGDVTFSTSYLLVPISELPLIERLVNIPAILLYYLKTFIFPWHLSIWQIWIKTATFQDFTLPLFFCLALFITLSWYIWRLYKREKRNKAHGESSRLQSILFFTAWYVLGMGLLIQVIPLNMTVAERWFYFPMVGMLGVIGVALEPILNSYSKHKRLYLVIAVVILGLLSVRTCTRVLDWKDNTTIIKHDAYANLDNPMLVDQLAIALFNERKIDEALMYENKSVSTSPNILNLSHLGSMYLETKQYDKAIAVFNRAIQVTSHSSNDNSKLFNNKVDVYLKKAYLDLAQTYFLMGRPLDSILAIEDGLQKFPNDSSLYYFLAISEYKVGNYTKALDASKHAYEISPNRDTESLYYHLMNDKPAK